MDTQFWQSFERQKVDGRYHLQCLLGNGAFGGVFLAQEMIGGQIIGEVAVKLILPLSADQAAQLGELIAMRNLNHPNVVRGLAAGECALNNIKLLYLVMDVATGTLEKRLQAGSVSTMEAKEIVRSIAEGLQFLHSRNMVHRDLKPGNILCIGGKWQLADFGLIRTFGADSAAYTQTVAGTPYYMPPESFKGEVSPAWDVWSLGVLIVVAFTQQYPFTGASHHEVANAILMQSPRIASSLPPPFDTIVQGCLVKDRRTRMTASQVLAELASSAPAPALAKVPPAPKPAASHLPTARTVVEPLHLSAPKRRNWLGLWLAVAGLVVGAVVWHAASGNQPVSPVHSSISASQPKSFAVHHVRHVAHWITKKPRTFRLASTRVHKPSLSHVAPSHFVYSHSSAHAAPLRLAITSQPRTIYRHPVIHPVTYRPHPTRSSIGDLHGNSSIGSEPLHGDSGNSVSSSGDLSGGLH